MKYLRIAYLILITCFIALSCTRSPEAAGEMINFTRNVSSLDEITAQIADSGKKGLLYFTTATCGPCKILQREVFTDDPVRAFVEANFIPYWVNSDSASGRDLDEHFDIRAVPTVVMINADGTVIDKVIGQTSADDYLKRLQAGLSGNLMGLKQQYEAYPGNNEIALEYAIELTNKRSYESALPIYEALKDKFDDAYSNGLVYYNLANCYRYTNQSNLAMAIYEEGIKQDFFTDNRNLGLANLVRLKFDRNDFSAAIKYANEIVDDEILEDPSPSQQREAMMAYIEMNRVRRLATLAYYKLNDPVQGKNLLDQLCQKMGDEGNWLRIAEFGQDCLIHDVAYADILPWTKKAVEMYQVKEDYYTLGSYGGNLAALGRYDEAIEIYQRKLAAHDKQLAGPDALMKDLMPEKYKRYVLRTSADIVVLNYAAGHRDAGQALFDEILTDNAEYNVYESLIISVVSKAPQLPEAFHWAEKAISLSEQENPQLLHYYAELLFKNGNISKAVEVATRVCELSD
ncbi:MAG: thioredoxin family protein, partial [Desulfobacterales bacterium]|nr:thioredoxin family protein [Desulfobacterales bacterium]